MLFAQTIRCLGITRCDLRLLVNIDSISDTSHAGYKDPGCPEASLRRTKEATAEVVQVFLILAYTRLSLRNFLPTLVVVQALLELFG